MGKGVGWNGGDWLTSYSFTGDPFGIGNRKIGMLQFQFVR